MAENAEQPDATGAEPTEAGDEQVQQALVDAQSSVDQIQQDIESVADQLPEAALAGGIELLGDVDLEVMIELGRTEMLVEDVLKLQGGSVVELDKLAGDPVDVHVNGRLVARGEVLVLNDNFCIRISEIVANLEEQATAAAEQVVADQQSEAETSTG